MTTKHLAAALRIFIASSVLLSSIHATQVWGAAALPHDDAGKKIAHDDGGKVVQELHHHSDKSGSQLIKDVSDQSKYFDSRTQKTRIKRRKIRSKLAHWQRLWERFLLMSHVA